MCGQIQISKKKKLKIIILRFPSFMSQSLFLDYQNLVKKSHDRDPVLDTAICSWYGIPGHDASYGLMLKIKIPTSGTNSLGTMGPSVDMAMRSLVNQGFIWYFDLALPIIRTKIIDIVKNVSGLSASTRQSISLWAGSSYGDKDFLKYLSDRRTEILNSWLYVLNLRPSAILQSSLSKFHWNRRLFDRDFLEYSENLSIFGVKGL